MYGSNKGLNCGGKADPRSDNAKKCEKTFKFLDTKAIVGDWKMGDVLIFDKFLYHKSQPMKTLKERYSIIGRFITSNSRYKQIPSHLGTHKKNSCKHNLTHNEKMITPCYPQIYPNPLQIEREARDNDLLGHDSIYSLIINEVEQLFFN